MRACVALLVFAFAASCADDPSSLRGPSRRSSGASGDPTESSESDPSGSSGGGASSTGNAESDVCFNTINEYRQSKGLPPYERWAEGESCAAGQAKSDAESGQPHGAFPGCGEFAQNECPGTPGPATKGIPQCLAMMWRQGPGEGHYDAMASTKWTSVACGTYTLPDGSFWSVQNFK